MGFFNSTIAAALGGSRVKFSYLVEFQFATAPAYFWSGNGKIKAGGKTWLGVGDLGTIQGIEEALSNQSAQISFALSGAKLTSQIVRIARFEDPSSYQKRLAIVWMQFFTPEWAMLDEPFALMPGLMEGVEIDREIAGDDGSVVRSVTLTCDNLFYNRRVPPYGNFSNADQRRRFPVGGGGLQHIAEIQDVTIAVPW